MTSIITIEAIKTRARNDHAAGRENPFPPASAAFQTWSEEVARLKSEKVTSCG